MSAVQRPLNCLYAIHILNRPYDDSRPTLPLNFHINVTFTKREDG